MQEVEKAVNRVEAYLKANKEQLISRPTTRSG